MRRWGEKVVGSVMGRNQFDRRYLKCGMQGQSRRQGENMTWHGCDEPEGEAGDIVNYDCTSMSLSPQPQLALMSLAISRRLTCSQLVKASKRSLFQSCACQTRCQLDCGTWDGLLGRRLKSTVFKVLTQKPQYSTRTRLCVELFVEPRQSVESATVVSKYSEPNFCVSFPCSHPCS